MKNTKVLIFGASGMLGHKLYQIFREKGFDTYGTIRGSIEKYKQFNIFDEKKIIQNLDIINTGEVKAAFGRIRPEIVINAVGLVPKTCTDPVEAIKFNSLFPHQLASMCREYNAKLVQISTDCVFSGKKGNYSENDTPDADYLYGRSKLLGEVIYDNHLTIRTSIIGKELLGQHGLVEWFLSQKGTINGYTKAIFTGLTTAELGRVLTEIAEKPEIKGLLNISTEEIDKFSLLKMVQKEFGKDDIEILPYDEFVCDRSLNNSRMKSLGITVKNYPEMIKELSEEKY